MTRYIPLCLLLVAGCASTPPGEPRAARRVDVDSHTLLAEIAWERQRFREALEHYLEAARLAEEPAPAERATTFAYQLGLNRLGLAAAERWRELAPEEPRLGQFFGIFETRLGRADAAFEHFRTLIEQADDPAAELAAVLELLAGQPDSPVAVNLMFRLVDTFPDTAEGHYALAQVALRTGRFDVALEQARLATEAEPQWTDAQLLYARALLLAGRSADSLRLAERLAEEHDDVGVDLQYAELLLSAGRSEAARQRLDSILEDYPGLPEAVRALGFLALTEDRLEEARVQFGQLRGEERYRDEAFYYLGRIAETEERFLQATRSYSRVTDGNHAVEAQLRTARILLTEFGDSAGALQHLREFGAANRQYASEMWVAQGQLLLQMQRPEDALALLGDALSESPDDQTLHAAQTQLYVIVANDAMSRGDLARAQALLAEGLDRYPGNTSIRYAQALLYQQQGRNRRSVELLEALVAEQPEDPALLNALGYLLTDRFERHDEARGYIQKALAMAPDNPAIIDSMGWVLFKLGDYEAAFDYLQRAYRLEADPEIAAHLVDVHWALGRKQQALELLRSTLEAHPDSPHLRELSDRLDQ